MAMMTDGTRPPKDARRDDGERRRVRRGLRPAFEPLGARRLLSASIVEIGAPAGFSYSSAFDINNSGEVVGTLFRPSQFPSSRGFRYKDGQMTLLETLGEGWTASYAAKINEKGDVVGSNTYFGGGGGNAGVIYPSTGGIRSLGGNGHGSVHGINDSGFVVGEVRGVRGGNYAAAGQDMLIDLGYPGAVEDVNNAGVYVGRISISDTQYAFVRGGSNAQFQFLGLLAPHTNSVAMAINESGEVAGYGFGMPGLGFRSRAFYHDGETMHDLGPAFGSTYSRAYDINESGQIVGAIQDAYDEPVDAILYEDGRAIDLQTLLPANSGWDLEVAYAINDRGQIVGLGFLNGKLTSFLLDLGRDDPAPTVDSFVVDDGTAQRSAVRSLEVTFNERVTVADGAFALTAGDGTAIAVDAAIAVIGGQTRATLTFPPGSGVEAGSLADGNYRLTIRADLVEDVAGGALDGDGDGRAGGDATFAFHRFFGDIDGDRDVDNGDLARFRLAYGSSAAGANYNAALDSDGDGDIDGLDLEQIQKRLRRRLAP